MKTTNPPRLPRPSLSSPPPPPPAGDEVPNACRYPAGQTDACLGWWEGGVFRGTNARLGEVSLRGCTMTVDRLPPRRRTVWFRPRGTTSSAWIEAGLLEARQRLLGPRIVRIAFNRPFSYDSFKALVYGPDAPVGQ